MTSPRRARSLFLSHEKAELLAAQEINTLVRRVEVLPRDTRPKHRDRADVVVQQDSRNQSGVSTPNTIRTVDRFCKDYRPPSLALHRLSYLDKELPPTPPPDSIFEKQNAVRDDLQKTSLTQKHAACQTVVSMYSRSSSRKGPLASNSITSTSSNESNSNKIAPSQSRRFSPGPNFIDDAISVSNPHATEPTERPWRSEISQPRTETPVDQETDGICPGSTSPHNEPISQGWDEPAPVVVITAPHEEENELQASSDCVKEPSEASQSRLKAPKNVSKRKTSFSPAVSDDVLLKTNTGIRNTKSTSSVSKATSKHIIPLHWSFHNGFTTRQGHSVTIASNLNRDSAGSVRRADPKRVIPVGWTFHDGVIFAAKDQIQGASRLTADSKDEKYRAAFIHLPIAWSFHDGLTLKTDAGIRHGREKRLNGVIATNPKSRSIIRWTFNDGLIIERRIKARSNHGKVAARTQGKGRVTWSFHDGLKFTSRAKMSVNNGKLTSSPHSRGPISWSFHDGSIFRTQGGISKRPKNRKEVATKTMPKGFLIDWSFHNGFTVKQRSTARHKGKGINRELHPLIPSSKSVERRRITYSFWDGITIRKIDPASHRFQSQPKSRIRWTFHEGITNTAVETSKLDSRISKPKHTYGWTFHDGFLIKPKREARALEIANVPAQVPQHSTLEKAHSPQPNIANPLNEREPPVSPKMTLREANSHGTKTVPSSVYPKHMALPPSPAPTDPSPPSKRETTACSPSEGSYFPPQADLQGASSAPLPDRRKRPPASRANSRVDENARSSETRYLIIENGKAVPRDLPSHKAQSTSKTADPLTRSPESTVRRKRLRSQPSLENWDGLVPPAGLAPGRRQRSKPKPLVLNEYSTSSAQASRSKDVLPRPISKYNMSESHQDYRAEVNGGSF